MVSSGPAEFLGTIGVAVLAAAAAIHLYWALGGEAGKKLAVPERPAGGGAALRPGAVGTLAVAMALAIAADLVAVAVGINAW